MKVYFDFSVYALDVGSYGNITGTLEPEFPPHVGDLSTCTAAKEILRCEMKTSLLAILSLWVTGCASNIYSEECNLPPLMAHEVDFIARRHLEQRGTERDFIADGESRVTELGCRYEFELAEALDSFGQSIRVEVSRRREITGISSGH